MKYISRGLMYMGKYIPTAVGALISLLLVNAANLYMPQLLRILIDRGIQQLDMGTIWWVAGSLVLLALGRGIFNFLQGYWSEVTSQGIAYELRNVIFAKLQNLSFSYHDRSQTGKLMTNMTSDVELVRHFTGAGLLQLIGALLSFGGAIIILFIMNWLLTLVFLAVLPLLGILFFFFVRSVMPLSHTVQQKLGALNSILQENLAGIRIVKAFAREPYEMHRYAGANTELFGENLALIRTFARYFPMIFFIANLGILGVLWVGGNQVFGQQMSLGELVAFMSYQSYLLMPVMMLGFVASMMSRAEVSAQRIFEVIDAEEEIYDQADAVQLPQIRGRVAFDQVSFRYAGAEEEVIRDITFAAEPGQTVAILGQTGSGKSSIINLIPRFYEVTRGRVLIDDYDVRSVKLDSLRSQIGIVLQETTLFSGTIRENIAYGRPDARLDDIIRAAKIAQAHDFINDLPEGYETIVGERGVGLSGGQRQRIAIARAILLDPRILIMDDSTSSVDSQTEYLIQQALEKLRQGRTTFVIAQRISTIRDADLILVLDQGQLAARGRHDELMQTSELYSEILDTQFGERTASLSAVEEVH
jgi:ATP-binding cassette, subfamily B, multidrug efflux pump